MAVQLTISYETLVELVEQLPPEQRRDLLRRLLGADDPRELSIEDRMALLRAAQLHHPVKEEPSIRREDWYDDDDP